MPDIDLGVATNETWDGDGNGRVRLRQNHMYESKKDVLVSSPQSIELSNNTNLEVDHAKNKFYFTTYHGDTKMILAILDSEGNLYVAGNVEQQNHYLTYD